MWMGRYDGELLNGFFCFMLFFFIIIGVDVFKF